MYGSTQPVEWLSRPEFQSQDLVFKHFDLSIVLCSVLHCAALPLWVCLTMPRSHHHKPLADAAVTMFPR